MLVAKADTLVIAEAMAAKLRVYRSHVFVLHAQEGFSEVGRLIADGKLKIEGYKFLILLFGRADLWGNEKDFRNVVGFCLQTIRSKNEQVMVILNAALPVPNDSRKNIRTIGIRNNYLALLAEESPSLEFLKPGRALICMRGLAAVFYENDYVLNVAGLQLVKHGIESTFRRGHLRQKFQDMRTGPSQ